MLEWGLPSVLAPGESGWPTSPKSEEAACTQTSRWPVANGREHKCIQEMQIVILANNPLWMINEVMCPFD